MSAKSKSEPVSLNQKLARLDELLAWFERDDFEVEAALEKYQEAMQLSEDIKAQLADVKHQITVLDKKFDQSTST